MIEIISKGTSTKYEVLCDECKSVLHYNHIDVHCGFITCPVCGASISVCYKPAADCKSTEIPSKHGRLIDADAFKSNLIKARYADNPNKEKTYNKVLDILFDAPTIVEAST